jgi:signal peptidase I
MPTDSTASATPTTTPATRAHPPKSSVKETLTSIIIAFALAFVFRGFVMEAFLIPTGSMAPTLLGQHIRLTSPQSGFVWPANTRDLNPTTAEPAPIQGSPGNPIEVTDPMTLAEVRGQSMPRRWGDRIFVIKYLYSVYEPSRWDVAVFKNPRDPAVNYIKRLIGLPNEMIALVDGDVFVRPFTPEELRNPADPAVQNPWALPGWTCVSKPERAQRAMWQPLWDSSFAPLSDTRDGRRWFNAPWIAPESDASNWSIGASPTYTYKGTGPTTLMWDHQRRPIDDAVPYNETMGVSNIRYPVSDIRIGAGVRPDTDGLTVEAFVESRGHTFKVEIFGDKATLSMMANGEKNSVILGEATLAQPLAKGRVTNIDFWHADQTLSLYVEDELVISKPYTWSIAERVQHSMDMTLDQVLQTRALVPATTTYSKPAVGFAFSGGGVTLHRVHLARDIFYRPDLYHTVNDANQAHSRSGQPAAATHPAQNLVLTTDQFFFCGDNSGASLDGRLWDKPEPWSALIDPTTGIVPRDLLIGKAFFVYFPAPFRKQGIPVPDFGETRWIW